VSVVELGAVFAQFFSAASKFFHIGADFLAVFHNLCFAGAATDIPAQLGVVLPQFRAILSELIAALLHFIFSVAYSLEFIASHRFRVLSSMIKGAVFSNVDHFGMIVVAVT
jgi:hypothetical protein